MTEAVSLAEAERFLRGRYGARAGRVSLLGSGEWSRAYAFALDGQEVVARFGAHGEDFAYLAANAQQTTALADGRMRA